MITWLTVLLVALTQATSLITHRHIYTKTYRVTHTHTHMHAHT